MTTLNVQNGARDLSFSIRMAPPFLFPSSKMCFICKTSAYHYVKQAFSASQRKGMLLSPCAPFWLWEVLQDFIRSHSLAWAAAACEPFEADTDSIHQPLHLCLMALCRHSCLPVCLMCTYRMPTYTFMSENQQAAQRQGAQMDFLIQLFAGSFFSSTGFWSPSQKCT